jgi:hypothetical protein
VTETPRRNPASVVHLFYYSHLPSGRAHILNYTLMGHEFRESSWNRCPTTTNELTVTRWTFELQELVEVLAAKLLLRAI